MEKTCENCANWRPKPDVKEPTGWICPKCGRSNSPFTTFCSHCSGWFNDWWTLTNTASPAITADKVTLNTSETSDHT